MKRHSGFEYFLRNWSSQSRARRPDQSIWGRVLSDFCIERAGDGDSSALGASDGFHSPCGFLLCLRSCRRGGCFFTARRLVPSPSTLTLTERLRGGGLGSPAAAESATSQEATLSEQ